MCHTGVLKEEFINIVRKGKTVHYALIDIVRKPVKAKTVRRCHTKVKIKCRTGKKAIK